MTLLERDECATEEGELAHPAAPSIFTEACNNETYMEVSLLNLRFASLLNWGTPPFELWFSIS